MFETSKNAQGRVCLRVASLLAIVAGCSANSPDGSTVHPSVTPPTDAGVSNDSAPISKPEGAAGSAPVGPIGTSPAALCDVGQPVKGPGCPCVPGEEFACWTGPIERRNRGGCQDGKQVCIDDEEFPQWGPCTGEVQACGELPDGGQLDECPCVPGAVALCDEDCSTNILCIPWSTKTCLPDGTWGLCREQPMPTDPAQVQAAFAFLNAGVNAAVVKQAQGTGIPPIVIPSAYAGVIPCGNVYYGCGVGLPPETWVGDCAKHFVCGRAPGQL